jgi:hypothetical protein
MSRLVYLSAGVLALVALVVGVLFWSPSRSVAQDAQPWAEGKPMASPALPTRLGSGDVEAMASGAVLASFSVTGADLAELGFSVPEWGFGEPALHLVMYQSSGLPTAGGLVDVPTMVVQVVDLDHGGPAITLITTRPEIPAAIRGMAASRAGP